MTSDCSQLVDAGRRLLFVQVTVDDPAAVPYWGYFQSEPAVNWVAGAITETAWSYEIVDADCASDTEVLERVANYCPDVVGFSCYTPGFRRALRLARKIKQDSAPPFCIFGGWHPSLVPESVLAEDCVDAVAIGQGERLINAFLRDFRSFRGQAIRAATYGTPLYSRPARKVGDDFARFHYFGVPPLEHQRAATVLLSDPGCTFRCTYCCTPAVYGNGNGPRALEQVMEEVVDLVETHGVNFLALRDDNPALYSSFLEQFCDAMISRDLNRKVRIHSFGDTRLMTPYLLALMARAGWSSLNYGVDSFSQEQLRNFRRSPDLGQIERVFRQTQDAGIFATANIILWQPGDTVDSFERTANALRRLHPDEVLATFFVPFPGTEDGRRYESYPKRTARLEDYHMLTPVLELDPAVSTETLMRLRRQMLNTYYKSQEYAELIDFRKRQFGSNFEYLTTVRRDRMLRYGIDIWKLPMSESVRKEPATTGSTLL